MPARHLSLTAILAI